MQIIAIETPLAIARASAEPRIAIESKKSVAPAAGTMARYRVMEWLNFIGSELHKSFSPLFNPAMPEEAKALSRQKVLDRLKWVDGQFAGKDYLMGSFSVADAYLYTVSRWGQFVGVDTSGLANLQAFKQRMEARPGVQAALKAEGLIK